MTYREAQDPPPDAEPAALLELSVRMRKLRARVLFPVIILGVFAGVAGAIAHVSGLWSVTGRFADGSYFVHRATVAAATLLPAAVVLGVGWMVYLLFRQEARRRWRVDAARRFRLDEATLSELEQTFL
jgi:H+/Cl- antiporter ClcA